LLHNIAKDRRAWSSRADQTFNVTPDRDFGEGVAPTDLPRNGAEAGLVPTLVATTRDLQ
jgi:hypothetical protein